MAGLLLALTVWSFRISSDYYSGYAQRGFDFIPAAELPTNAQATRTD